MTKHHKPISPDVPELLRIIKEQERRIKEQERRIEEQEQAAMPTAADENLWSLISFSPPGVLDTSPVFLKEQEPTAADESLWSLLDTSPVFLDLDAEESTSIQYIP